MQPLPPDLLVSVYQEALAGLDPRRLVRKFLNDGRYAYGSAYPNWVFAFGKAARPMLNGFLDAFEDAIVAGGMYVTHETEAPSIQLPDSAGFIRGYTTSHPLPDERSVEAARVLIRMLSEIPPDHRVFFLISGGTSALLEMPREGVGLETLRKKTEALLISGNSIHKINAERKKMSAVKGGQLLQYLSHNNRVVNLIFSDVPGDDPAIIGSGPTVPDDDTVQQIVRNISGKSAQIFGNIRLPKQVDAAFSESMDSVKKYLPDLLGRARSARDTIMKKAGMNPQSPGPPEADTPAAPVSPGTSSPKPKFSTGPIPTTFIIGSASVLANTVKQVSESKQVPAVVYHPAYDGDIEAVAEHVAAEITKHSTEVRNPHDAVNAPARRLLVFYGESSVKVTGSGKGGRNTELALRVAHLLGDTPGYTLLSAGTDGRDGNTDAAGAWCSADTLRKAGKLGLQAEDFIKHNDSYSFFAQTDGIFRSGVTGNNLMDMQLVLIERKT